MPGLGWLPQGTWTSPEQVTASCSHLGCVMEGRASGSCSFLYPKVGVHPGGELGKLGKEQVGKPYQVRLAGALEGSRPATPILASPAQWGGVCQNEMRLGPLKGRGVLPGL